MIKEKVKQLLKIVNELRLKYPEKENGFTLDGRLVGDIGEVLALEHFEIKLHDKVQKDYDAVTLKGNHSVQIKATMRGKALGYPKLLHPERYLGIVISKEGEIEDVVYNGETKPIEKYLKSRKAPENFNLYTISIGVLKNLNNEVDENTRIDVRKK